MLDLESAIKHCEEVADLCEYEASKYDMSDSYESHVACQEGKCAEEHRQLAEWLKDYQRLLKEIDEIKAEINYVGAHSDYAIQICFSKAIAIIDKHIGKESE